MRRFAAALIVLALAVPLSALEGKWTPQQVLQLDAAWLKKQGLEIPPSKLWNPEKGTGLLSATISTGGCSAGFISGDGLFITNHHCLFSVLQENATPENDVITNGYLARTRDKELTSRTLRVTAPRKFVDVTKRVLAAIPPDAGDVARARAIRKESDAIVAACEKQPNTRCRVAAFDGGLSYVLQEMTEFKDVRLVYAPPRAVGEYGGETDNWMWPRHTGDFSIGRVYADGKPFHPPFFFPISTGDLDPGDFVMVLGYPGVTYRSLTAAEMEERVRYFDLRRQIYGDWIRILEETTKGNAAGTIAVASDLKSMYNGFKNAEGQLAGFKRGAILEKERAADKAVLAWAAKQPKYRDAVAAHEALASLAAEELKTSEHDRLVENVRLRGAGLPSGPKALAFASGIARGSTERLKSEDLRDEVYTTRNRERLGNALARAQKSFFGPADKALFENFVQRAMALPKDQHVEAIDRTFAGLSGAALRAKIDELYAGSRLLDADERAKMIDETSEQLHARRDPLIELGFGVAGEIDHLSDRQEKWEGMISRLRPEWRAAVIAHAGKPVAPDANSTLRVSFAHVKGYAPHDGLVATPQTTLGGSIEKHTGAEPFDVPQSIRTAYDEKRFGRWKDPELKDVPIDFLADADTTGGNSGSPVVNGRGELVGVNFDRVWENVANDFGYNPDVARNISVDVRYLLWILEEVTKGDELLKEMGVAKKTK